MGASGTRVQRDRRNAVKVYIYKVIDRHSRSVTGRRGRLAVDEWLICDRSGGRRVKLIATGSMITAGTHRCVCSDQLGEEEGIEDEPGHEEDKLEHGVALSWGVVDRESGVSGWWVYSSK